MRSETFQVSSTRFNPATGEVADFRGALVVGYVFESLDESPFVNHSYDARLAGVRVNIEVSLAGGSTRPFYVTTDADGFYSFFIARGEFSNSHRITVVSPDRDLLFMPAASAENAPNEFTRLHVSRIGPNGDSFTAFIQDTPDTIDTPRHRFQIIVRNSGLVRRA